MKNVPIKNKDTLDLLSEFEWFVDENVCNSIVKDEKSWNVLRYDFCSDDYLRAILNQGKKHSGFPAKVKGYGFNGVSLEFKDPESEIAKKIIDRYNETIVEFSTSLMLRHNALFTVYPPGGFISWHNNANASAYNFIFTWSENGDGYWQHYDYEKKKIIKIPDKKGWNCKAGYFGSYNEPKNNLVYHMASTDCWRMTVAFVLDRSDMSKGIQEQIIEELSFTD